MGRAKRRETWLTKSGQRIADYGYHPGALLSQYIAWQRPNGGYATIPDPEPDTINVAILSRSPVNLDLTHTYHYRPSIDPRFWISFGRSDNIKKTIDSVSEPWIAYWTNSNAAQARPYIHQQLPVMSFAKDIPAGERAQYMERFSED